MYGYDPRGPKGAIIIDGRVVADTFFCVHCGCHFTKKLGTDGRWRNPGGHVDSFCLKCMGPTCGRGQCDPCMPFEKKLEQMESGV